MILADIGNTNAHVWHDGKIEHLGVDKAIDKYRESDVYYINVNNSNSELLKSLKKWTDIQSQISISGEYEGMGIDRKTLCLACKNGLLVDAGSAITIDKVVDSEYLGGFILPGLYTQQRAYADISPVLDISLDRNISLNTLPKDTRASISYGIVSSVVSAILKIADGLPVYFTGGDGEWLSRYIDESIYDEELLFRGMIKTIKRSKKC